LVFKLQSKLLWMFFLRHSVVIDIDSIRVSFISFHCRYSAATGSGKMAWRGRRERGEMGVGLWGNALPFFNFGLLENCHKNVNFGAKIILRQCRGKVTILSTDKLLCRKFATTCPAYFVNRWHYWQQGTVRLGSWLAAHFDMFYHRAVASWQYDIGATASLNLSLFQNFLLVGNVHQR